MQPIPPDSDLEKLLSFLDHVGYVRRDKNDYTDGTYLVKHEPWTVRRASSLTKESYHWLVQLPGAAGEASECGFCFTEDGRLVTHTAH